MAASGLTMAAVVRALIIDARKRGVTFTPQAGARVGPRRAKQT